MQALAQHVGLPFVDLDPLKIDAKLAPQLLSRPVRAPARRARHRAPTTAPSPSPWPTRSTTRSSRRSRRTCAAQPRLVVVDAERHPAPHHRLLRLPRRRATRPSSRPRRGVDIGNLERYVKLNRVEEIEASDSHVVSAVEYLLHYALDQRASDVHIEPRRDISVVRMRIDGVLHTVHQLPEGRAPGDRLAHQDAGAPRHRREAPPAGRPHQDGARRPRGRDARVDRRRRLRREARHPHLRPERAAAGSARARDVRRAAAARREVPRAAARA